MTKDTNEPPVFQPRNRTRQARAAIRANRRLDHEGPAHETLMEYLLDLSVALGSQHRDGEDASFAYVVRCMGELASVHADAIYEPYGYDDPFACRAEAPEPEPEPERVALWTWPTVNVPTSHGGTFDGDFKAFSALKLFGYTVGKTDGWPRARRRAFLADFIERPLPPIVRRLFGDAYGAPLSTQRLRKTANVIANNASLRMCSDPIRYATAIGHWTDDLDFLKEAYYEDRGLKFHPWPTPRAD